MSQEKSSFRSAFGVPTIHLLGPARLVLGAGAVQALDRKSAALLALAHIEPGIARSTVARWLWPDADTGDGRANLRVLVYRLAKAAGRPMISTGKFLAVDPDISMLDEVPILRAIEASTGEWLPLPQLLDGLETDDIPEFEAWLERARRRVAARYDSALRDRVADLETEGKLAAAVTLAQRLVEFDPAQESSYRELMRLQIMRGERGAALAAFERCRHWLSDELGVGPSAMTRELHLQALRLDDPAAAAPGSAAGAAPGPEDDLGDMSLPQAARELDLLMSANEGDVGELERLARTLALRLPSPELEPDEQAYACGVVAYYHMRAGRNPVAMQWSESALAAARAAGPGRLGWALVQRAGLAIEVLDLRLACDLLAEAERLVRPLDRPYRLSKVWHQIGCMLLTAGLLEEAESAIGRAIALWESAPAPFTDEPVESLSNMQVNLACCLMDQGRYADAESAFDRGLLELDKRGQGHSHEIRMVALLGLGYVYRVDGRPGQARTAIALARAEVNDLTMKRNRLFLDLYERLLEQMGGGAAAAERTLDWVLSIDAEDALRIYLLRDLSAMCMRDGETLIGARAREEEARLRLAHCRAIQRGHSMRWIRGLGLESRWPSPPPAPAVLGAAEVANDAPDSAAMPAELEAVERMCMLAELREGRDGNHGARVGALSGRLARHIGAPAAVAQSIEPAARLHDLGKAALSEVVLKAANDPASAALRARHTEFGAMLLAGSPSPVARLAELISQQHHEHWVGNGQPLGLAGVEISLPARIVAIADTYDLAYAEAEAAGAFSAQETALAALAGEAGRSLDPRLARDFAVMMRQELPTLAPASGDAETLSLRQVADRLVQ